MSAVLNSAADAPNVAGGPSKVLRILHLSPGNLYGGVETLLSTLARLRRLCPNMEPEFGVSYEGRLSRELVAAGVRVHILGPARISRPWTIWRARRRLKRLLDRHGIDVAVCHMPWSLAIFGGAVRASGYKLILWAHGAANARNWLDRVARRTTPDLVISNSSFVAASVADVFPNVPALTMYYPVAPAISEESGTLRRTMRLEQGAAGDTVVIVQVSRFEAWKGHALHLNALAQLKTEKNWVCWMIGGPQNPGEERLFAELQETTLRLGLSDRVKFLGQRSDVPALLAAADVFCQPNQGPEPFGIVFVEALFAGRPVVATAIGGALEIIDDTCGILVEPGNPTRLAGALQLLIDSPGLRSQLGQAGPARARKLCDPAAQMSALRDLAGSALGQR